MLRAGFEMFVHDPKKHSKRVLHPGKVREFKEGLFIVEFVEPLGLQMGQDLMVFAEVSGKLMQQGGRVASVLEGWNLTVGLELVGEPVSAESRQAYRVSTVIAELTAAVNNERTCPLLDVSMTGFAVSSAKVYTIGTVVAVTVVTPEGKECAGRAYVQSVKELGRGRFRYGLNCIDEKRPGGSLLKALQQISVDVQRQHLRRLRRSA